MGTPNVTEPGAAARALARALLLVSALVVAIVSIGGITRLTESGVSITEWKPVTGAIPPLTHAQWQAEFDAYRLTPQFQRITGPAGMTLESYKAIYFWEWLHRLVARAIGTALVGIAAWFAWKRAIPEGFGRRLVALVALVGLQGAVGWWMVVSGIEADVRVSHLRLATHLALALTLLGALVWTALDLLAHARGEAKARLTGTGALALAVVGVQLVLGALVAGLRAGVVAGGGWFNWQAWPRMQGAWFPAGVDWGRGTGHAVLFDPYLLHFLHRWWAWVVVAVLVWLARRVRAIGARPVSVALHSAFGTQILLGITTVWGGVALPIAVAHQTCGALVLACTVWAAHRLGRPQ